MGERERWQGHGHVRIVVDRLLEQRQLSIYQLSRRSGLPYQTCYRLVRQTTRRIDLGTIAALCHALDCEPGDIFVYEPPER